MYLIPCNSKKELNGDWHGPQSLNPSTRARIINWILPNGPFNPNTSLYIKPWYDGDGEVNCGYFPLPKSYVPL